MLIFAAFVAACSSPVEERTLLFPVRETRDVAVQASLSPEPAFSDPLGLVGFSIRGNELIAPADFMGDHCLSVYDLAAGDISGQLCRKGRGPEEFLAVAPWFSLDGDILSVVDLGTGKYSELRVVSDAEGVGGEVLKSVRLASSSESGGPLIMSLYRLSENRALGFNSIQGDPELVNIENPRYAVYDTDSGAEVRSFALFDAGPMKEAVPDRLPNMAVLDCLDRGRGRLYFAMAGMPVIASLDLQTGDAGGVRIKEAPEVDFRNPATFFDGICTDGEYIYATWQGRPWDAMVPGQVQTTLYKFDLSLKICGKYQLDGMYRGCVADSGRLYLSKVGEDQQMRLYRLDLAAL